MSTSLAVRVEEPEHTESIFGLPPVAQLLLGRILRQDWVSIDDLYLWGTDQHVVDPWLRRAVLLVVNRRRQKLPTDPARLESPRSLFLLRTRQGEYLCGRCFASGSRVIFQPKPGTTAGWREFLRGDVQIIGKVTGIVSTAFGTSPRPDRDASAPPSSAVIGDSSRTTA